jgi:hypothetical protein
VPIVAKAHGSQISTNVYVATASYLTTKCEPGIDDEAATDLAGRAGHSPELLDRLMVQAARER